MTTTTWATVKDGPRWSVVLTNRSVMEAAAPTSRSLTTRRNPRGRKSTQELAGQNNPRTGASHPRGQNPEGTEATLLAIESAGTVPARELLAGAKIRGGDGFTYIVANRQVNGDVIVRRMKDGAWATLRPTDRVRRTSRSEIRDFPPSSMLPRKSR